MRYKFIESKDTEINYFELKDNNEIHISNFGHIQMQTKPRTNHEIDGVDVYTVVEAMKQRLIKINGSHKNNINDEIILHLLNAEQAMKQSKDNRIYRGLFF